MTFVLELGIAAIANELETTMAVAVAAAMAAVMERIGADSREDEPSNDLKARPKRNGVDVFSSYTARSQGSTGCSERANYSPITLTAVFESVFVPLPSCPKMLYPQHLIVVSASNAHE